MKSDCEVMPQSAFRMNGEKYTDRKQKEWIECVRIQLIAYECKVRKHIFAMPR